MYLMCSILRSCNENNEMILFYNVGNYILLHLLTWCFYPKRLTISAFNHVDKTSAHQVYHIITSFSFQYKTNITPVLDNRHVTHAYRLFAVLGSLPPIVCQYSEYNVSY